MEIPPTIILLSKSPARVKILEELGFNVMVKDIDVEEVLLGDPIKTVKVNSLKKFMSYRCTGCLKASFDTVIYFEGEVIGKPNGYEDAKSMMMRFSGKKHDVYTGFTVGDDNNYIFDYDVSTVYFSDLSESDIEWYLSKREYIGAAGGYRIQGFGKVLIRYIVGDFYNIVGLPIHRFFKALSKLGWEFKLYL